MKKNRSIIYVNYSPYENSGKILDFLLENFEYVFLFSLGFHSLKEKQKTHKLFVYHNGKLKEEQSLFRLPDTKRLLLFVLPFISLLNFIQIIWKIVRIKNKYGKIDVYFTVNGFTAWIGNMAKKIKLVDKTVFWVWDYYPPQHENKIISLMRRIYRLFDEVSLKSDKLIFINNRILELRRSTELLPKDKKFSIIPIGTDSFSDTKKSSKEVIIGFIGVIKKSQGLSDVFNNANSIIKTFPNAKFEIIGSGPDDDYFKKIAKNSNLPTTFHGYLEGESFNDVLKKCTIGVATYLPDSSNVSHFGDPGKVKRYLALGMPVIITDVFEFAKEIEKNKAGVIIKSGKSDEFANALKEIMDNHSMYSSNALNLAKKYYYKKIYPEMFDFS